MIERDELDLFDAFKALKDIDDSEVQDTAKSLNEGITVNVSGAVNEEEIKQRLDDLEEQNNIIQVIDANADEVEHLKNGIDYVGQFILSCKVCRALVFTDEGELLVDQNDPNLYNVELECPHCHSTNKGFALVGQVGKIPEKEMTFENETKDVEEPAFENDVEQELEIEEQPSTEEKEEQDQEERYQFEEEPEKDYFETEKEDDTNEIELPALGEMLEEDTFDLEEEPFEYEEEEEDKVEVEVPEEQEEIQTVGELLDRVLGKEDIPVIKVANKEKFKFEDVYENLPETVLKEKFDFFDIDGNAMTLNIDSELPTENRLLLKDAVKKFSVKEEDEITFTVHDLQSDEDVLETTQLEEVVEKFGEVPFIYFEFSSNIEIFENAEFKKEEEEKTEEDELTENILKANHMSLHQISNINSNAYWINESIYNKQDLEFIFDKFVKSKGKDLIEQFKAVTGYEDEVDKALKLVESQGYVLQNKRRPYNKPEILEEINEEPVENVNEQPVETVMTTETVEVEDADAADNKIIADLIIDEKEAIEGYDKAIDQLENASDKTLDVLQHIEDEELEHIEELSKVVAGTEDEIVTESFEDEPIGTVESDDDFDEEADEFDRMNVEAEKRSIEADAEKSIQELETIDEDASVIHCKDRKELAQAVNDFKNKNKPYSISKSTTEGYRYDLVEAVTYDEPEEIDSETDFVQAHETDDEVTTAIVNPVEEELVRKLMRISKDICDAIESTYNVTCQPELVMADIIQDLKLIKGEIKPEDLPDNLTNNLTKEMFDDYSQANDFLEDLFTELTGEDFHKTPEERFQQAIKMLDSNNFSTTTIWKGIQSTNFKNLIDAGQVPYITVESQPMIEDVDFNPDEGSADRLDNEQAAFEAEREAEAELNDFNFSDDIEDVDENSFNKDSSYIDEKDLSSVLSQVLNSEIDHSDLEAVAKACEEYNDTYSAEEYMYAIEYYDFFDADGNVVSEIPESLDFDSDKFDEELNEYFNQAYDETVLYVTESGKIDEQGNILLEGRIQTENETSPIKFSLTRTNEVNESITKNKYKVTNNLSEEVFEFEF